MVLIIASIFATGYAQDYASSEQPLNTSGALAIPIIGSSTYENSIYGFRIGHPQDWQAQEPDANDMGLVYGMLPPHEDAADPLNYVALQVETLPKGATLEQYSRGLIGALKQSHADLQILSIRAAILGDSPAGELVVTFREQDYRFQVLKVYTIREGIAFIITYNALAEEYDHHLETVREAIDSFEFEPEAKPVPEPSIGSLWSGSMEEGQEEAATGPDAVNATPGSDGGEEADPTPGTETDVHSEVETQISALEDGNASARADAAKALGELNDARAIEPLIRALRDEDGDVRLKAGQALGRIGEPAVMPLIRPLDDDDEDLRFEAEYALKYIGTPAVAPLIRALEDDDWRVRSGAAGALGWIRACRDLNSSVSFSAAYALGKIGPSAAEPLIEALMDDDGTVRSRVAFALGEIKDTRAVEPLIQALNDEESMVRADAADALGEIGDPRAVEPLIQALGDEEWLVRKYAADGLGELKDPRAIDPLKEAVNDEDEDVRSAAEEALARMETES